MLNDFNIKSPQQLSILLFGGEVDIVVMAPIVNDLGVHEVFKTGAKKGEFRYKKTTKKVFVRGFGIKPSPLWATKKAGIYRTDEKVLLTINNLKNKNKKYSESLQEAIILTEYLLKIRKLEKEISTYCEGFEKLLYPDHTIHGHLSHCGYDQSDKSGGGTKTGRLSSVRPNLQNIPRNED